jgi:putative addiction module component (TIGR02574 family)
MDFPAVLSAANELSLDDRLRLVETVWDGIAAERPDVLLTDAQRAEIDRRVADDDASPDDIVPWEQVKAEALARAKRQ